MSHSSGIIKLDDQKIRLMIMAMITSVSMPSRRSVTVHFHEINMLILCGNKLLLLVSLYIQGLLDLSQACIRICASLGGPYCLSPLPGPEPPTRDGHPVQNHAAPVKPGFAVVSLRYFSLSTPHALSFRLFFILLSTSSGLISTSASLSDGST